MTVDTDNSPESPADANGASPSATAPTGSPSENMSAESSGRSGGTRTCPNCGSSVSAHASVCPTCGEGLNDRGGRIRCRFCGERSSAELTICPHCGRELSSAPPRIVTWGIPIVLALLLLAIIMRQADASNPLTWAQERLTVEGFPTRKADHRLVVMMTPVASEESSEQADADAHTTPVVSALAVNLETDEVTAAQIEVVRVGPEAEVSAAAGTTETSESAVLSPEAGTVAEALESDGVSESAPSEAAADVGTNAAGGSVISDVVEAESTDLHEPATEGEAAEDAAEQPAQEDAENEQPLLASVASVSARAGSANTETAMPIPTATRTETPIPKTDTPTPTVTPTPTTILVKMPKYSIRRGDTLMGIAQKHDVTVDDLMRVNEFTTADVLSLQPGQEILIPVEGSIGALEPTATPTFTPKATEVIPPTNTPAPTATTPALRLDAPILRSPDPGTPMNCSNPGLLTWLPVPFMRADDVFVLHLGFVNGKLEDGRDSVQWVLEQPRLANTTSWDMDGGLCSLASQDFNREWHWWVEVSEDVGGTLHSVSPPSETWEFDWN